ncbi:MAG: DUF393 domain-containing protein [Phycisphaerae bacterium]|nr:DUF393 domain-containing protein [Phycisphaerae bacterium]
MGTPVILFDGVCNLCHGMVRWVIRMDRRERFRFASLKSRAGREALAAAGWVESAERSGGVVLIDGGRVLTGSGAVIGIARGLGFPWSLAAAGLILPRAARDGVYAWVARRRYRWFGVREECPVLAWELRERFLDADESAATREKATG